MSNGLHANHHTFWYEQGRIFGAAGFHYSVRLNRDIYRNIIHRFSFISRPLVPLILST